MQSAQFEISLKTLCFFLEVLQQRQESMADWHGIMSKGTGSGGSSGWRSMRDEDFEEEDVWVSVKERDEDSSPQMRKNKDPSGSVSAWRLPSAPRPIPRATNSPTTTHEPKMVQQSSAPVNIPDWSKIYGKKSATLGSRNRSWVDDEEDTGVVNGGYHGYNGAIDDDSDDDEMVPPHEWIAKKLARSQISSFSMCEGIGRTLKGRDLSKVRNAILTKTGFLE